MARKIKIPTKEDRRIEATELDIASILFESMADKIKISQLEQDLGGAVMEIMAMKMGGNL